jgi:hypothetical protein
MLGVSRDSKQLREPQPSRPLESPGPHPITVEPQPAVARRLAAKAVVCIPHGGAEAVDDTRGC